MSEEKPLAILLRQNFHDFDEGGLEEKLEPVGQIFAFEESPKYTNWSQFYSEVKMIIEEKLREEARKLNAKYVFSVRYDFCKKDWDYFCRLEHKNHYFSGFGYAYKVKKP